MPSYDFEVDIASLAKAAKSALDTVQTFKDKDVSDLVPTEDSLGSDTLWSAVDEFQDRWDRGINDMTEDISEVAGRLGKVAQTYLDYDDEAHKKLAALAGKMPGLMVMPGSSTGSDGAGPR